MSGKVRQVVLNLDENQVAQLKIAVELRFDMFNDLIFDDIEELFPKMGVEFVHISTERIKEIREEIGVKVDELLALTRLQDMIQDL